jgi:histidyl-tRNA synthetase
MHDILPEDQAYFQKVQKSVDSVAGYYGFLKIETPI